MDAEIKVHAGGVAMAKDVRSQKLKLIGHTQAVEDVVIEFVEHKMALDLYEYRIES